MIKVISFDLDGTLVDKNFDELLWLKEIPEAYAEKNNISVRKAKQIVFSEYEGKEKKLDYKWSDVNFWCEHFGIDKTKIINKIKHEIRIYPDVVRNLDKLKRKHTLVIVTQSDKELMKHKIKVEGIESYFKIMVSVPSEFKKLKKDSDVFKKIIESLNIKKDEIVHIGDDYVFDYEIPKKAGIRTFYLDRKKKAKGEDVVYSLTEFADIIEKAGKNNKIK